MGSCRRRSKTRPWRRLKARPPRQIGWVISVEDWALIRRLVADGVPQRQVARDLGIGRSTVERALASDRPPKYERAAAPTSFAPFEPLVRQLLIATPDMPATLIAERVGWKGSITWSRDNVLRLRPEHRPVNPSDRLIWLPGDAAQCDLWFPPGKIPLENGSKTLLPVLVITAAQSRFMLGRMIPTRHTQDLLLAMWELLTQLGRVPRPGHRGRSPRPPGSLCDRDRVDRPAHRGPPRRPASTGTDSAAALQADHRRRGRLPALRTRRREPVLPARLITL